MYYREEANDVAGVDVACTVFGEEWSS